MKKFACYENGWLLGVYKGVDNLDCARLAAFEHGYERWDIVCVPIQGDSAPYILPEEKPQNKLNLA